jgi:diacylglycerol kinase (ATP)
MGILFIVNPKSAEKLNSDIRELVAEKLKKQKKPYHLYFSKKKDGPKDIDRLIEKHKPSVVVAVGGDGTINLIGPQLAGSDITMGIIPMGSANGLARNLDIPNDFSKALSIVLQGKTKPMDVIRINRDYYCLHLSDIGINARIVKRFEKEGSKGLAGYGKQFFKEMFSKNGSFKFTLDAEGAHRRSKAEMLVIANAQKYGTGAQINPNGKIDDGLFELVIIKSYPWWHIFPITLKFFTGHLHTLENVEILSASWAKIHLKKPTTLQVDGEVMDKVQNIEIDILPKALKVICP